MKKIICLLFTIFLALNAHAEKDLRKLEDEVIDRKGKLLFPLSGKIISYYGNRTDPQLNTVIFQKGIEISAKQGQEVRAIYEGTVLYADWFKGYGNIIIIDHGGSYYSLSAHVSKLFKSVGERVEAGEVIALAGDTGSLKGNCLYFELRHHGKPLNPLKWLQNN